MPWLQPKTNNYFGFMPATASAQVNTYAVSSSEVADINIGDVVVMTSIGTMKVAPTGGLASGMAGVAASFLAASAGSISGATLNTNTSKLLLVYDDPNQMFVGCDTTSAAAVSSTQYASTSTYNTLLGQTYAVLTTGCIGSTGPSGTLHQSVMALSGNVSTYGAATGVFKIIGLHPIENGQLSTFARAGTSVQTAATAVRKYLLKPSTHQLAGDLLVPVSSG